MSIRLPTPKGPPLHPVFTRKTAEPCCEIFSPSICAYTLGLSGKKGAPKHVENVA
jgi:hypothetical protein